MEKFTFTVGKLDAGMAILIGERAHLIEFPSILLPPGVSSGSIVNISVNRNQAAEKAHLSEFWALQDQILNEYGIDTPQPPELKLRHVTQTSVTLEWPKIELAKADLRALEIYKNGQRLALIPNPKSNTSTKLSSLQSNEEYSFQLVLKTTAGIFPSNIVKVRTHTMTDTSGISVCFGSIQDENLVAHCKAALKHMHAKWTEAIEIDTTHFVCQSAGPAENNYTPSSEYQKAIQVSLPIVQPQWVLACQIEKKLVPVSTFQLGANTPPQYQPQGTAPQEFQQRPKSPVREEPSPEPVSQEPIDQSNADAQGQEKEGLEGPEKPIEASSTDKSGHVDTSTGSAASVPVPDSTTTEHASNSPIEQSVDASSQSQSSVRSPKPEADGKLDRAFKFPSTSPPADGQAEVKGTESVSGDASASPAEVHAELEDPASDAAPPVNQSIEDGLRKVTQELASAGDNVDTATTTDQAPDSIERDTTDIGVQPRRSEPKKTASDVDVAARQWLNGQKPVDASGELESFHSTKVLDQVLDQKAAAQAEKQAAARESPPSDQQRDGVELGQEERHLSDEIPVIEVQKDHGNVEPVGEEPITQEPTTQEHVITQEAATQEPVTQETIIESRPDETAPAMEDQLDDQVEAGDANDDEDETPVDSTLQTPAESPSIPGETAPVTGATKKKKNKKKSKK